MSGLRRLGYEVVLRGVVRRVIRPGDCVWDVGANRGLYTRMFGEKVGPDGTVVAFEPVPHTAERLRAAVADLPRVRTLPLALSDSSGDLAADLGDHPDAETARIFSAHAGEGDVMFRAERGDDLVREGIVPRPQIVKIDVEGHELEVLQGMEEVLSNPSLRHLFIEVHFAILGMTDRQDVPTTIVRLLEAKGYRLRWVDQSHVWAARA
nr:FkbM family methyltransferase [Paracraurococcus ruber]